ncbi:hypothetical protein DL95DRAFT_523215 [Leptodontidium sp. 2 PMI_412]|nr:hypothetical protein DL95DRAFT_523215 [Leptodontidium sp. 2 PMI_412]
MSSSSVRGSQEQREQVRKAAQAVGFFLGGQVYAIVGGAACVLLGSTRATEDVDIVVPQGATKETRQRLKDQAEYFHVEKRTLHTYYKSDPLVEIEVLAPPAMFKEDFSSSTPVVVVDGVNVLKPALILNSKCNSITGRPSDGKKQNDATDIRFCLRWCARNNALPTKTEVPRASKEFVEWYIDVYGGREDWQNAGYNFDTGSF